MSNLWIFGDSFSEGVENFLNRKHGQGQYVSLFLKKNKQLPTHFSDIIKREYFIKKVYNYAEGGFNNYSILESIGQQIQRIEVNDIVCIGWSEISRYRIPYSLPFSSKSKWANYIFDNGFFPSRKNKKDLKFLNQEFDSHSDFFNNLSLRRNDAIILKELTSWQNILKASLPKRTVFWSPFRNIVVNKDLNKHVTFKTIPWTYSIEVIADVTSIDDHHFSENGYITAGEFLCKWIQEAESS